MQRLTLLFLASIATMALAEGQYYVPRAYYTIDPEGHASAPVPLRRLRRSIAPYPWNSDLGSSANANANANADAYGGGYANAQANANARANSGGGGWSLPYGSYGAANPNSLRH